MNKIFHDLYILIRVYLSNNALVILTAAFFLLLFRREIKFLIKKGWKLLNQSYFWMFRVFPRALTIPMFAAIGLYFFIFIPAFLYQIFVAPDIRIYIVTTNIITILLSIVLWLLRLVVICGATLLTIAFFIIGFALCNVFAVKLYRKWRKKFRPVRPRLLKPILPVSMSLNENDNPLKEFQQIGIILSGGGAKGAYQAGAMKAVYEFLEAHNAHHKVKMIAGTSIGSWNAMFWLANLVAEGEGHSSPLQEWWSNVNVGNIVEPSLSFPLHGNFVLSSEPWQDNFDAIFNNGPVKERLREHITCPDGDGNIHFYFTHTNVVRARLEYTTNNEAIKYQPSSSWDLGPGGQEFHLADSVERLGKGVFSSMDLPLAFEYVKMPKRDVAGEYDYFEDGGVIDNLPIRFGTEVETCDLLFVLPLNAGFEKSIDEKSLLKRLFRVMDIRQGALEHNSFRMVKLYNEFIRLQRQLDNYERIVEQIHNRFSHSKQKAAPEMATVLDMMKGILPTTGESQPGGTFNSTLHSEPKLKEVRVFAACPGPDPLIKTAEFWKKKEAAQAFTLMYKAVRERLYNNFTELIEKNHGYMMEVDSNGKVTDTKIF